MKTDRNQKYVLSNGEELSAVQGDWYCRYCHNVSSGDGMVRDSGETISDFMDRIEEHLQSHGTQPRRARGRQIYGSN